MRKTSFTEIFAAGLAILASPLAMASTQTATLTQTEGEVKLFTQPTKTLPAAETGVTRALYEGQYFVVKDGKIGDKVDKGTIVRTAPTAKARVVYDNGDQFNVGPGTAYQINWSADTAQADTKIDLMYGKFRGIVEKGGPRSKLQLRTKSAVMGVRGTDFFVAANGADNTTEVSILRGAVELKPEAAKSKPVEVKAGQSAEVSAPAPTPEHKTTTEKNQAPAPVEAKIELRKTTQEDLAGIQKASQLSPNRETASAAPAAVTAKLKELEKKAVETTMKDIKNSDAKLYAEISKKGEPKSMDDLNNKSVQKLMETAPKAPEKHKPYQAELEDLEAGAYQRYFKDVQ